MYFFSILLQALLSEHKLVSLLYDFKEGRMALNERINERSRIQDSWLVCHSNLKISLQGWMQQSTTVAHEELGVLCFLKEFDRLGGWMAGWLHDWLAEWLADYETGWLWLASLIICFEEHLKIIREASELKNGGRNRRDGTHTHTHIERSSRCWLLLQKDLKRRWLYKTTIVSSRVSMRIS